MIEQCVGKLVLSPRPYGANGRFLEPELAQLARRKGEADGTLGVVLKGWQKRVVSNHRGV